MHSGDWNLDPNPTIGQATDAAPFKKYGEKGVLAYIGDSTNAEVDGTSGSERDVAQGLAALFRECKGRIIVTIFASNIGRLRSICLAAKEKRTAGGFAGTVAFTTWLVLRRIAGI